jgi:hypothetical protein
MLALNLADLAGIVLEEFEALVNGPRKAGLRDEPLLMHTVSC